MPDARFHDSDPVAYRAEEMFMTLTELNALDRPAFTRALGHLFEHSPWVAERTHARGPFADIVTLHTILCETMRAADFEERLALIRAHPDLAGRLAKLNQLTAESTREQASAGLDRMGDSELAEFTTLNEAYKSHFQFPFIICARLNDRASILTAMKARVANRPEVEFEAALSEIEKIAWLRLRDTLKTE
jgi:2-oxo-4-hydroxy-4-carboxy-5-ureidoimidazoline decarboxylase